jgi:GntR family transcriptional regulator / MocR family aminotransferase
MPDRGTNGPSVDSIGLSPTNSTLGVGERARAAAGTAGTAGPELLVELRRGDGASLRAQLEAGLRAAIRAGRLGPGARLPATRVLARDLGVSRRVVVEAFEQLCAEGYLEARTGAGTFVSLDRGVAAQPAAPPPRPPALRYDFFPGAPDLAGFPRADWLRATREALRRMPDQALGYPDPRGAPALRAQLAAYLRRARGVVAEPDAIVVVAGAQQAFGLIPTALRAALGRPPRIAVEDPGMPRHRAELSERGARLVPVGIDADGLRTDALAASGADAVLATPAHQSPSGVALSPARRGELAAWARAGGIVIEDDYDAEFRYDRAPLGALQGLAPDHVLYVGSTSKTLAPGLRLGWVVAPARLVHPLARARAMIDAGSPAIDQHALAELIDHGAYDRHLRAARRRYRARRDALVAALERHVPGTRVEGVAAGLHAVVRPPDPVDETALLAAAAARSVGVYPLGWSHVEPRADGGAMVLGYATLPEPAIRAGVRLLAEALAEARAAPPSPPPTAAAVVDGMTRA